MKSPPVVASLAICSLLLSACSVTKYLDPYMVDVRQGNYVTQEMVAQLKPGMTRDQVRFTLGTPLVTDVFHADRWDYLYRYKPGRGDLQQRHLSVYFDQDKLARVGGDVVAGGAGGSSPTDSQPQVSPKVIEIGADGKVLPVPKPAPADKPAN